jgi:Uncharacterized protein family UPF0029/RWD domain
MDTLEEEFLVLDAIYPECIFRGPRSSRQLTIHPFSDTHYSVSISLSMPENYPEGPPSITASVGINQSLVRETLNASWTPGEVCLYVFIDKLRELPIGPNSNVTQGSSLHSSKENAKTSSDSSSDIERDLNYEFAMSEPIVDRKSTFVGRAIEVHSRAEAQAALTWLKEHNKKVARATHNIIAWRVVENGILMQGINR